MDIKFPLLSILSVGFLLFFALQGGDIQLHSIELGFSADSRGATVTVDPSFFVHTHQDIFDAMGLHQFSAGSIGNVVFLRPHYRPLPYTIAWEENHVKQYRALGLWYFAAYLFSDHGSLGTVDPWNMPGKNFSDYTEPDRIMWLPPDGWVDLWHFITLQLP